MVLTMAELKAVMTAVKLVVLRVERKVEMTDVQRAAWLVSSKVAWMVG